MKIILLILTFILLPFLGICQGTWTQELNFPDSGRSMALTTTVGDTGFMFMGYKGGSFSYATWLYDHSANSWTQKAPFPGTWRTGAFVFALNGNIFIGCGTDFNGSNCKNDVWKYSIANDTWTLSTPYPADNREGFAYYTYNNKGYVVFGRSNCSISPSSNFYEFDPVGETWTALTPYLSGGGTSIAAVYDNKVFFRNSGTSFVLVYDLITNQWENTYPNVPNYPGNNTTENLIVSGNNLFEYTYGFMIYYHPASRTWLNYSSSYNGAPHEDASIMVFGDTVKFLCGKIPSTNNHTNDIWNFYTGCTSTINAEVTSVDSTYFGATTELQNTSVVTPANFAYTYHWQVDTLVAGWLSGDTSFIPNRFGNVDIQLIADNGACADTFTKTIYVNPGMWSPKTILPTEVSARSEAIVFPIGNFAYMGFGRDFELNALKDFYKYDPATQRITKLNDFPDSAMSFVNAITHNGKGYILGGSTGNFPYKSNKFYEYDPITDSWTQLPDFPGPSRASALTFIINNELYLCLGTTTEIYKYNFSTSTWTQLSSHPQLNNANHAFTYNGKGLIMINANTLSQLWQYDPGTDSWSVLATNFLPENLSGVSAALVGNKIWIGYGKSSGTSILSYRNSTVFYDLISGQTTPGPSSFAIANSFPQRINATFFQLNGYTYSCFGKNNSGCDRIISRFEPDACVNIPMFYPDDKDEAGIGIPIRVVNTSNLYLPPLQSSFQLLTDGIQTASGITQFDYYMDFRICGEHKIQWVMNDVACTDTFTFYPTAHPVYNIISVADMPLGVLNFRHTMNSFSINGKGYMGMGNKYVEILSEAYKDWYEYSPATNSWAVKSSLPAAASNTTGSACFTDGTNGYITSGTDGCFVNQSCYLNDTWMYDPVIDTWTAKADWPVVGRYTARATALGDTAFAGLGYYTFSGAGNIYKYSFSADTWTNANWPYGVGYVPPMFTYNNEFYAGYPPISGSGNDWGLYKYSPSNGTWSQKVLKYGEPSRAYLNTVKGNEVYLFEYDYVYKIDLIKMKMIPIQPIYIPGDTSNEFSAGFAIGDQVYFSLLNLDYGARRGNHFYQYDLAAPVCNLDSLILGTPNSVLKNTVLLNVSPNPATDKINLEIADPHRHVGFIQIADVTGKILMSSAYNLFDPVTDVRKLSPGTYIVSLKNETGTILTSKKFIINR